VSAPARPSGGFDVAETERTFAGAARAALAAAGPSDALETHASLYADDLDVYAARFDCGGVSYKVVRAPAADGTSFTYSLVVPVPDSFAVVELVSANAPAAYAETWPLPRYSAALPPPGHVVGSKFRELPALTALAASYATADVDKAVAFYRDVLGAETALDRAVGGSRVAMLRFPSDAPTRAVEVHYVAHGSPDWDVAALEYGRTAAHAAALVSETSGFDQWMDGHIGHRLGRSNVLDGFLERARAAETPHVLFTDYASSSDSWTDYLYLVAPGGAAVQLVGNLTAGGPAEPLRAFSTCEASGGTVVDDRRAFELAEADKNYQLHPHYEDAAKRIEASFAWLEDCAS
jgi:catechol 2,3-dioxygenase-like lactoylglutathione lyase family enzyme